MAVQPICTHCGAKIKAKGSVAPGKKIRCPKCDKVFVVGDDDEPDEVDDDDDETPKSKKKARKSGKSNSTLLIGAIVGVLLLCCICGGGGGGGVWVFRDKLGLGGATKDANAKGDQGKDRDPLKKTIGEPDRFVLDPLVLANEIQTKPLDVIGRYKDKPVEITSEVERIIDRNSFVLKGSRKTPIGPGVSLNFRVPANLEDKVARLTLGQKVKVSTRPEFKFTAFDFGACTFVEVEPSKLTPTPAATVFREFSTNLAGTIAKYRATGLIISGKLTRVEVRNDITGKKKITDLIELDAGKPNKISIRLQQYSSELAFQQNLQAGDEVEIRCEPSENIAGPHMFLPAGILVRKVR